MNDEYCAAIVDTRSRLHIRRPPAMTMHIPQCEIADAVVDHLGAGRVDVYYPADNPDKLFHVVTVEGDDLIDVLARLMPYMVSDLTARAERIMAMARRAS